MNRRVIGLVVAVVLAAVATVALYLYVQGADERAQEDVELRQVYAATERIEAGTAADAAINQGLIQQREVPQNAVAEGAIGSLEQIQGLVATVPVVPGQQIVAANFGESSQVDATTEFEIPEGQQAVSIDLNVVPGVAGFIDAGDRISIVSLVQPEADGQEDQQQDGPPTPTRAQYLLQNVEVLAVGQRVTTFDENGNPSGKAIQESNDTYIFTVALAPADIERLVFGENQTTLWAALQRDLEEGQEFEPFNTPGATADNLFQ